MSVLAGDLAAALDPVVFARGLGFEPEGWQVRLLRSCARKKLVTCSRQVGKTTTTAFKAVHTAVYSPGALVLIFSPTQRQSNEMLRRCKALYKASSGAEKPVKATDDELVLSNGSRVLSLPGTEGTTRGFAAAKLLVLDEAARVPDEIFAAVLPMVAGDGEVIALSTPWGRRGWFFDLHEDALNGWERHKVSVHQSAQWPESRIADVRSSVGKFAFSSDYLCEFGDSDSVLFDSASVDRMFSFGVAPLVIGGV